MTHHTPEGLPPQTFAEWMAQPVDCDMLGTPITRRDTMLPGFETWAKFAWEAATEALRAQAAGVEPAIDKSVVRRLATQMGWTPPAHVTADVETAAWIKLGLGANPDYKHPTHEPAQAVDLHALTLRLDEAHDESLDGRHGVAREIIREVTATMRGNCQPQAQQGGGEVREALKRMLAVFKAATKDRVYTADVAGLLAADIQTLTEFATKEQRS